MVRTGPEVRVETGGHSVQPDAVGAVDPRPGVGLADPERDLAGQEQLAPAERGDPCDRRAQLLAAIAAQAAEQIAG